MQLRIKDIREDRNIKQKEIAKILHTSQQQYSRYETEERPLPIQHLIILAKFYHTSADYLLGLTDEKRPYPPSKRGGHS